MFAVARTLSLAVAFALIASPALATPLGLNPGDVVEQLEWASVAGGSFTTGSPGAANVSGDIQSVTIQPAVTSLLSGVTFTLDLDLASHFAIPIGGSFVAAGANFVGSSSVTPDFTISDNTGIILQGNLTTSLILANPSLNLLDANPTFVGGANIIITGGDSNLVAALGGVSATGEIQLTGGIYGFSPTLASLLGDLNAFNENFTFSGDGIIVPDSSSPFAPEPSTALLLAGGMLGLVGVSRRARRRS